MICMLEREEQVISGVRASDFFKGFRKTLVSCLLKIWQFEKVGSHVDLILLSQPAIW